MSLDKQAMADESGGGSPLSLSPSPPARLPLVGRFNAYLQQQVTPADATYQLLWACFLTGYTCAVTFTACYIWCGFQTGGTIQLALALARLFTGDPSTRTFEFEQPDRQALTSLLGFLLGTSIGRLGDRIGPKRRVWLVSATVLQALCMMAAALTAWKSGEGSVAASRGTPVWVTPLGLAALAFSSASMGIQGIVGKRLATEFATCVVLTTIWVELINDPKLFARTAVKSRDHKAGAIFCLFVGGLVARCIIETLGSGATLGIGAGMRVLGAVWWIFSS